MAEKYDILVAGEINPDLILSGDVEPAFGQAEKIVEAATLTVGSSSVIFACGAARLGLRVGFIGKCGDDFFGRFMLEEMQRRGVDVSPVMIDPRLSTGLTVILNRGEDRAMLTFPGAIGALRADEVSDDLLRRARHLHVASYFLQDALRPGLPELFRRARALGLTTSLDTNYDPAERWEGVVDLLPLTDVFLPNAAEARALTGEAEVEAAARALAKAARIVAVKLGAAGAMAVQGEQVVYVPSIPVKVVDTVGAGDNFDAGFLYGFLMGWPLERALRLGTVCGALSTQAAGGVAGQPTLEEAMPYLEEPQ
ncbi:carbohydrate kinase family protein [Thermoflexus sp.]|uniref:carbohydrate kinase family protein n=1 Tax=Thermoflexus sp. TaxID=1969742 RepID=UPI0025CD5084|nr:carbohydrate kinase family protein [Thermoflexus sp.]MDW8180266.1 carbohydrate kinase family protein [Anaerolineae bacterium]MCS6963787.1 carbohydrate kinase family protein [Thermoflexus sp.]MCS7350815.1 carbohydrate kinase family protein [Thermoflexus sp.]MCX7690354.1 carbohydrate kinase family protein [Thermoflexus sp.]MDW8185592.1 carbohydrate kinase family protein [Anaerolineae bacterium]